VGDDESRPRPRRAGASRGKPKYDTRVSVQGTCQQCGKTTRTPFVPRDPTRVLCEACYLERFGRPPPGQPQPSRNCLHPALCSECGASCEIPWVPTEDNPAICWDCRKGVARNPESSRLEGGERLSGGSVVRVRRKKKR